MLLLVRQLVDTRKCPRCRRGAPSSREGTRSEVSWETSVSSASGNNGEYFARAVDTPLSPSYHGQCYPFSSTARYQSYIFIVGVPHLSLASSLLSFLPAIVSHTSGSYVVVELSRFLSASSHHLCGTDFVSSSSERPSCEKVPRILKNTAR